MAIHKFQLNTLHCQCRLWCTRDQSIVFDWRMTQWNLYRCKTVHRISYLNDHVFFFLYCLSFIVIWSLCKFNEIKCTIIRIRTIGFNALCSFHSQKSSSNCFLFLYQRQLVVEMKTILNVIEWPRHIKYTQFEDEFRCVLFGHLECNIFVLPLRCM